MDNSEQQKYFDGIKKQMDDFLNMNSKNNDFLQQMRPKSFPKKCRIKLKTFDFPKNAEAVLQFNNSVTIQFDNPADGELFFNSLK